MIVQEYDQSYHDDQKAAIASWTNREGLAHSCTTTRVEVEELLKAEQVTLASLKTQLGHYVKDIGTRQGKVAVFSGSWSRVGKSGTRTSWRLPGILGARGAGAPCAHS